MQKAMKRIDDKYYDLVSTEDLKLIVSEGDKLLNNTYDSEKDLTSKFTFFFNILITSELALFAFLLSNKNVVLLVSSFLLFSLFTIPIYNIYNILFIKIGLNGVEPYKFFNDDIIKKTPADTTKNILYTKVTSLQNAIDHNIKEHKIRLGKYLKNIRIVIFSILLTLIFSAGHHLFLLYQCK